MQHRLLGAIAACCVGTFIPAQLHGAVIYNNLTPNNLMGVATRPTGQAQHSRSKPRTISSSARQTAIDSASFVGLLLPDVTGAVPSVTDVVVEIYRIFPLDSDTTRTPNVPTRTNSPSDVALRLEGQRGRRVEFQPDDAGSDLYGQQQRAAGGIHPKPNQTTLGNGPVTGEEVQFDATFTTPIVLPPGHYFFVPQVASTNGGNFMWLSASRPISGAGTTPFPAGVTDLQEWTRDANLDPDWLRVGTDIVGGSPAPTFNAAFSLSGTAVPEPASAVLIVAGLGLLAGGKYRAARR